MLCFHFINGWGQQVEPFKKAVVLIVLQQTLQGPNLVHFTALVTFDESNGSQFTSSDRRGTVPLKHPFCNPNKTIISKIFGVVVFLFFFCINEEATSKCL